MSILGDVADVWFGLGAVALVVVIVVFLLPSFDTD